jgi:hypothetical protein
MLVSVATWRAKFCRNRASVAPRETSGRLTSDRAFAPESIGQRGDNLGTIRGWFWGFVFVAVAACFYWLGPSVYSIKYAVSADKIYVDPKPTDCDFWHAPVGKKGCHYQRVVIARDAKEIRAIRPGESDPNQRFDSVFISWVKKSD